MSAEMACFEGAAQICDEILASLVAVIRLARAMAASRRTERRTWRTAHWYAHGPLARYRARHEAMALRAGAVSHGPRRASGSP